MESFEWLGCSTASDHVHHGSLDFSEVSFTEEVAKEVQDSVPSVEDLLDWVVQNQVQITLSVSRVLGQDLLLALTLGDHVHAVRETHDLCRSNGELTSLGPARAALNTDNVSTTQGRMEHTELTLVLLCSGEDLNLSAVTLKIDEDQVLSLEAESHDTASQSDCHVLDEDIVLSELLVVLTTELVHSVSARKLMWVWVHTLASEPLD